MDKINAIHDSRISHCYADLNGRKYHYLLGIPKGDARGTVFLVHGWPDLSMGWRYQIPMFLKQGYRVVAPDLMGFGRTEAPGPLNLYSFKQAAIDINELASQLGCPTIILGGHDWGGAVVYRVVLWFPKLVSHLFSICTPYAPPSKGPVVPLEVIVEKYLPTFRYQIQLASGQVEKHVNSEETIRGLLSSCYGGKGPSGEIAFSVQDGVLFENLTKIGLPPLLTAEELDYYTKEYFRNGIGKSLNWYRTREINHNDELSLEDPTINIPVLFIAASDDKALPPSMSEGMEKYIPNLIRKEVKATHWAPTQVPEQVNGHVIEWLNSSRAKPLKSSI